MKNRMRSGSNKQRGREIFPVKLILDQPTRGYAWQDLNVMIAGQGVEFRCWKSGAGNLRLDTIRYQRLD